MNMKKYIILTLTLLACIGISFAQDEDSGSSDDEDTGFERKAMDFTGAITFGRGTYLDWGSTPSSPGGSSGSWSVNGSAPSTNIDANQNGVSNMIGGEARFFILDNIAVKLSGGAILSNTPARQNIQYFENDSNSPNATWIPQYASVEADNRVETNINIGGEYHFSTKPERIFPYLGANFNYYYSRRSVFDPTINYSNAVAAQTNSGSGYSGSSPGNPINDPTYIADVGIRSVFVHGIGGQAVAGLDFYLLDGLYAGFEIKPVSYLYAYNTKIPGPGLESWQAETHTWSFFSQPVFKIGFFIGSL